MGLFICICLGKIFNLGMGGYYFRSLPLPYRLVFYLTALALLFECYGFYLGPHLHRDNSWLFNIYTLIDAWFMGIVAVYLVDNKRKYFFFVALAAETIIWILNVCAKSIYICECCDGGRAWIVDDYLFDCPL